MIVFTTLMLRNMRAIHRVYEAAHQLRSQHVKGPLSDISGAIVAGPQHGKDAMTIRTTLLNKVSASSVAGFVNVDFAKVQGPAGSYSFMQHLESVVGCPMPMGLYTFCDKVMRYARLRGTPGSKVVFLLDNYEHAMKYLPANYDSYIKMMAEGSYLYNNCIYLVYTNDAELANYLPTLNGGVKIWSLSRSL